MGMHGRHWHIEFQGVTTIPFTPLSPHATSTLLPPDRDGFAGPLVMASPTGCMFGQILEPPEGVRYGLCILTPDGTDIRLSDLTPVIHDQGAVLMGVTIVREVGNAVQMGDTSPLPLSDPVKPNHTGTLDTHRKSLAELMPIGRCGRAILQSESESNADSRQGIQFDGL